MRSFYATARGSVNEIRATPRRGECAAALARWLAVRNLVATGVAVGLLATYAVTARAARPATTLTIEVAPTAGVAAPRVDHPALHAAGAACWRSHLGAHETVRLCVPASWSGVGDADAQLAISTRAAPPRADAAPRPSAEVFYTGEATVRVHAARDAAGRRTLTLDAARVELHAIATGGMTELTGAALDVAVHGSVALVP